MQRTEEQIAIIEAFAAGDSVVADARAGCGKTSATRMCAESAPGRRGVFMAFNKAIAGDAKASFPSSCSASTVHSLAFRAVGVDYAHRLSGPRVTSRQTAEALRFNKWMRLGITNFSPTKTVRMAMDTVTRFCHSADQHIGDQHVPWVDGIERHRDELCEVVVPLARRAWEDLTSTAGVLRFSHDVYLKLWSLSDPHIPCDYLIFDEAQDSSPVITHIVQCQEHAQKLVVGDPMQQIYEWRGAVDSMGLFGIEKRLPLAQSFRFGDAIAEEANQWLRKLDADPLVRGSDWIDSTVGPAEQVRAILCRTNAQVVAEVMAEQAKGLQPAIVGGIDPIISFAETAIELKDGRGTWHHDLQGFKDWEQVRNYVDQDHGGRDLRALVRIMDQYSPQTVIAVMRNCLPETTAPVVVSTAHKCSPPTEPILTVNGWKQLGDLDPQVDRLASYVRRNNRLTWGDRTDRGFPFEKSVRQHAGDLVVIETEASATKVTPEHRVLIAFAPSFWDRWAVYLMRRGDWWRVGMCRTGGRPYRSGDLGSRLSAEHADVGWILSVHDTRTSAAVAEARIQALFGLTGLMFERRRGLLSAADMHAIHEEAFHESGVRARRILGEFRLLEDEPLYRNLPGARQQGLFLTAAANTVALSGYIHIPCAPTSFVNQETHRRGGWSPDRFTARVMREYYEGPVYGLELPPHHFYVSGNAVVHNSKGREWDSVRLAEDFFVQPHEDKKTGEMKEPPDAELRLAYVACTRARQQLDPTGLYVPAAR